MAEMNDRIERRLQGIERRAGIVRPTASVSCRTIGEYRRERRRHAEMVALRAST